MHSGIDRTQMNPDARPQDDLFEHVNGGWLATAQIPEDRSRYVEVLRDWLRARLGDLDEEDRDKVEHHPMRVLDCKNPKCQDIVKAIADRVTVLRLGRVAGDFKLDDTTQEQIVAAITGADQQQRPTEETPL